MSGDNLTMRYCTCSTVLFFYGYKACVTPVEYLQLVLNIVGYSSQCIFDASLCETFNNILDTLVSQLFLLLLIFNRSPLRSESILISVFDCSPIRTPINLKIFGCDSPTTTENRRDTTIVRRNYKQHTNIVYLFIYHYKSIDQVSVPSSNNNISMYA